MTRRDSLLVCDPRIQLTPENTITYTHRQPQIIKQTAANIYLLALAQEAVAEPENAVTESHTTADGETQGEEEQGAESMAL